MDNYGKIIRNISKGDIVLSDVSQGMVHDARENLSQVSCMQYQCFDCLHIPYPDESFDVVIANHVLFYLKDLSKALSEIQRV